MASLGGDVAEDDEIVEPKAKRPRINNKVVDEPVYNSREERYVIIESSQYVDLHLIK